MAEVLTVAGYVVVYRHYLSLGGRDVEDMLRAAGTDPRPYRDAMRAALFEGKAPGSVAPGLLKSVGARRLLFPKGGARIAADDVDCIAQGLAAVRLCSWYKLLSDIPESMDAECTALDAAGYLELCESLYRDVYAKPARMANPYAMKQLDGLFRHVSSRLDDDISVLLRDSHGPAAGAMAFAAQDAAFVLNRLSCYRPFLHGGAFLALEAVRGIAAGYGCAVDFSGVSVDDIRRADASYQDDRDVAEGMVKEWLSFVGLE